MKVVRCNETKFKQDFEKQRGFAADLITAAGLPESTLMLLGFGREINEGNEDFAAFYLVDKDGKEYTAAVPKAGLRAFSIGILDALEKEAEAKAEAEE